ncbi:MAG: Ca-activated chloride channel [Blastocatellia bacterium]|jgi:Ca-activated chloride channel family protein|nr:Ca-activated chloride channel [Blastocatellia bacterium]
MKKAIHYFLFALAIALNAPHQALAQQKTQPPARPPATTTAPATPQQPSDVERITIRRVLLPITVLDKKGQLVTGLTASDFQIFEDKTPQDIDSFTGAQESPPLNVGVLMDTSPSTAGKIKFEQESAMNFIQTVIKPRKDRVAFVTFDDEIKLRQDFTDRLDQLDKAVSSVKKPGKQTALYDAIYQICDEKMRSAQGRRALVIITDGDDTYSRATLRDAIDIAQRTETTIFAISTKAGFAGTVPGVEAGTVQDTGDKDLVKLCEETGGQAFFTGDMLALERSFNKINKELHTQYIVTYKPKNAQYDGSYRRIEVRLAGEHGGMKVRTRHGYSAVADSVRP